VRCGALLLVSLALGCEQNQNLGNDEAFRVRDAQFISGALPGGRPTSEPPKPAADGGSDEDEDAPPSITALETFNLDVQQGQGAKPFRGRASDNASSVALAVPGVSTGHWVLPVGAPDTATGEFTWEAVTDWDVSIEPGRHALRVVAIDDRGRAGTQLELQICVRGKVADNGSACSPSKKPPRAVISLSWDTNVDLDLQVVGPGGKVFDAKHASAPGAADAGMDSEEVPALDRDSNPACMLDGVRTENLIWSEDVPEGKYTIYANLFDACKQPAVRFRAAVYTASERDGADAGEVLSERYALSGELLDLAVNPTSTRGLFVGEYEF
jgi:hypothetical protein